jgi:long-chain acyl-CoA synthetase
MNIASNLENTAFHFPDRIAIIEDDKTIRFAQFNQDANRIASALNSKGVRPGDHVALCAPNSYNWLAFYFGVLKAGAVAVTFSYLLMNAELAKILQDCKPQVLFTFDDKLSDLSDFREQSFPEMIICDHDDISVSRFTQTGKSEFKIVDRRRQDSAAILYTGGTTGIPKGAILSHENLQTSVSNVARYERSTENDCALCFLPLNHVFAQIHITHSMVYCGGGLVVQPAFDLPRSIEAIEHHQITNFYAVPTIYIRLLARKDLSQRFKSVRYCFSAAASMATEVVREWKARTGLHVIGSVGTPANLVEVQIRDFEGQILKAGEQGEICICGPNITQGYLNNPAETKAAFWGDWFRSGDVGYFDEDGYLYIVDRLKDMIITGGENVYPREVEEVLYTRPEILECAVVGLPHKEYGEQVTAFIVPHKDQQPDPAALKAFLKTRLAGFKVPKAFIIVDELPKNSAGKLLKREIKKQFS